jgi:hypothetical protein
MNSYCMVFIPAQPICNIITFLVQPNSIAAVVLL